MGTPQPRSEGSCLFVLLPALVGLVLAYYGWSEGLNGGGPWVGFLVTAGFGLAIVGPMVVGIGRAIAPSKPEPTVGRPILRRPKKDPEP